MLPPLICVHVNSPKHMRSQRVQGPEPDAPCTWLAGTEELLGHLRRWKTPICTVTAAPCPAESDVAVQTEKMKRDQPTESSVLQTPKLAQGCVPPLHKAGRVVGHPVSPMAPEYFPSKEQATCPRPHHTQPFWNSHQSLGVPAYPRPGDVRVTQRHPPHGLIRAGEHE